MPPLPHHPSPITVVDLCDPQSWLSPADRAWFLTSLRAVLESLRAGGEVRVKIVADPEMADAHQRFSGVAGTTDVLTFDLAEPDGPLDADLLLCADEARRQAAARGHPWTHELLLYAVHGILHCLGEDDHDESGHARMHAREDALLQAAGVGPVFARAEVSTLGGGAG
ncbi:MAG: rRNA maturation RNase YbeY [Phycisphaerales bacterium]